MDFNIIFMGCFTHQEVHSQILDSPWIFLNVSGLRECRWEAPDGATIYAAGNPGAFLLIAPKGTRFSFDYTSGRENWVCGLRGLPLRQRADRVELEDDGVWIPLAQRIPLTPEAAQLWAIEMRRFREASQTPLPRNALRAQLMVAGILRFLLDAHPDAGGRSSAQHLRELIDADEACRKSIEALSSECGFSSDHLRLRFQEEFGIAPQRYRMQRRMARAMDLVMGSLLPVKQIALNLGFPYVTHFSTAFRQAHHCSPREAIRRYRQAR